MKIFISILFLFVTGLILGQDRPELHKYENISIELKNGKSLEGIGKLNLIGELIFREDEGAEKRKLDVDKVESLTISNESASRNFEPKNIDGPDIILGNPLLIEKIVSRKMNLYRREVTQNVSMGPGMGTMPRRASFFYLSHPDSPSAEYVKANTYSRKFRKKAAKRFKNCPGLVQKIQQKEFERYGIEQIVKFYNSKCK